MALPDVSFTNNPFFVKGVPWKQHNFLFYVALMIDEENEFIPVISMRSFDMQADSDYEISREYIATDEQDSFLWKFKDPRICYHELKKTGSMPTIDNCTVDECFFEYKFFYKKTGLNPYCDQVLDYLKNFAHEHFIKFFKQRSYLADLVYFYYKNKLQIQNFKFSSSDIGIGYILPKNFEVENYGFCVVSCEYYEILHDDTYCFYKIEIEVAPFIKSDLCVGMLILRISGVDYFVDKKINFPENINIDYVSKGGYYCLPSTAKNFLYIEDAVNFYISKNLKTEDLSIDNFFKYCLKKNSSPEMKRQIEKMKNVIKIYCDLVNQTKFNVLDDVGLFTRDHVMFSEVEQQVELCRSSVSNFFVNFFKSLNLLDIFFKPGLIKIKWNRRYKMFYFYKK